MGQLLIDLELDSIPWFMVWFHGETDVEDLARLPFTPEFPVTSSGLGAFKILWITKRKKEAYSRGPDVPAEANK